MGLAKIPRCGVVTIWITLFLTCYGLFCKAKKKKEEKQEAEEQQYMPPIIMGNKKYIWHECWNAGLFLITMWANGKN